VSNQAPPTGIFCRGRPIVRPSELYGRQSELPDEKKTLKKNIIGASPASRPGARTFLLGTVREARDESVRLFATALEVGASHARHAAKEKGKTPPWACPENKGTGPASRPEYRASPLEIERARMEKGGNPSSPFAAALLR